MSDESRSPPPAGNADFFAAERTLLAWIRTGLAMMGFGFVVARFGLFLRELAATRGQAPAHSTSWSLWFGTFLVVLGVLVNLWSAMSHMRTIRRMERGEHLQFRVVSPAVVTAVLLGLLGFGMAIYLTIDLGNPPAVTTTVPNGETDKTPATPAR